VTRSEVSNAPQHAETNRCGKVMDGVVSALMSLFSCVSLDTVHVQAGDLQRVPEREREEYKECLYAAARVYQ
jgi:hypothetical protein